MKKQQLFESELVPGAPLKWHVFNEDDQLLLKKGTVIATEAQIKSLVSRGAWYSPEAEADLKRKEVIDDSDGGSPFVNLHRVVSALEISLTSIKQGKEAGVTQVERLASALRNMYKRQPDALLGAVHLLHEYDYSLIHSIHIAILVNMLLPTTEFDDDEQIQLICAALTCNITLYPLQDFLQKQEDPLNDKQQQAIQVHPQAAHALLKSAGVVDDLWLESVIQHHERIDGSGYPARLAGDEIIQGARMIAVADRYAAMVSKRAYRDPLPATNGLRIFFEQRGERFDDIYSVQLVKQMGMYPPGACVRLANGEAAIVTKRTNNPKFPTARAYLNAKGQPYAEPFTRRCEEDENYHIKECITVDPKYPLNLTKIWGFKY